MNIDSSASPADHGHAFGFQRARSLEASIQAARTQKASLEVVTAEGDRVSLSTAYQQDVSLDRYETTVRTAAGRATQRVQAVSFNSTSSVSLEVEGDLNEQERADIQALIDELEDFGAGLLSGTLDSGFQLGSSLLSAEAELSLTETFEATVKRAALRLQDTQPPRLTERDLEPLILRPAVIEPRLGPSVPVTYPAANEDAGAPPILPIRIETAPSQTDGEGPQPVRAPPIAAPELEPHPIHERLAAQKEQADLAARLEEADQADEAAAASAADVGRRGLRRALRLEPGRIQRQAAERIGDFFRQRPERANQLKVTLPRLVDRLFDRLGARFGAEPAEAARDAFQSLVGRELNDEPESVSGAAVVTRLNQRNVAERYGFSNAGNLTVEPPAADIDGAPRSASSPTTLDPQEDA